MLALTLSWSIGCGKEKLRVISLTLRSETQCVCCGFAILTFLVPLVAIIALLLEGVSFLASDTGSIVLSDLEPYF